MDTPAHPPRRPSAGHYAVWPGWRVLFQDLGLHPAHVLRRAGLPGDLLTREGATLDTAQFFGLWQAVADEVRAAGHTQPFALLAAQAMSAEWFEPALFAALCSADLNAALQRIATYKRLVAPMAMQVAITAQHTTVQLRWLDQRLPPPPVLVGIELVFFVQLARLATRSAVQPVALGSPMALPDAAAYEAYLGCRIRQAEALTVRFAAADAQRPFLTANHRMWAFFEPALRTRLHELDRQASMHERVRSSLLEALPAGDLTMPAVCRKLGVSARTLQRRLQAEGSSFQRTLDEVRTELARHYLQHSALSGAEISFLLGFEDPNSFVRAFQGWTGTTPQAARQAGVAVAG